MKYQPIPLRTHIITDKDDIVKLVRTYAEGIAEPGDVICVAESPVAITQGRAILPQAVRPSLLARFLRHFPRKEGSLATPWAMQLAIQEVGAPRVLLGAVVAGFGKVVGRRGDFYRVAGRVLALIDDIGGTLPPYDRYVILGPKDPARVVDFIRQAIGVDALIADVNDLKCVDILAVTGEHDLEDLKEALRDNPFGNDDERTPIVVLKRVGK